MENIFETFDLGGLQLPNRMVMAPMTRTRASEDGIPTDLMREYYSQRASAGLIITECTQVSDQAHGIIRAPGMHRADQMDGWRRVVEAVHARGGRIYSQIWHCGRAAHPDMRGGEAPVAPSPIAAEGMFFLPSGRVPHPVPRELATAEIPGIVDDFGRAAGLAKEVGFDGVELHGAFGYLQDQFLQDGSNKRTDAYGGSVANRARLMLETVEALAGVWGRDRVGVKLSPSNRAVDLPNVDVPEDGQSPILLLRPTETSRNVEPPNAGSARGNQHQEDADYPFHEAAPLCGSVGPRSLVDGPGTQRHRSGSLQPPSGSGCATRLTSRCPARIGNAHDEALTAPSRCVS